MKVSSVLESEAIEQGIEAAIDHMRGRLFGRHDVFIL